MKAAAAAAAEGEPDGELSPLPAPAGQPRRRGAISAEPVTEEDATSYVKKVKRVPYPKINNIMGIFGFQISYLQVNG